MYCVHCGKQIEDGLRFCPFCGMQQEMGEPSDELQDPVVPPVAAASQVEAKEKSSMSPFVILAVMGLVAGLGLGAWGLGLIGSAGSGVQVPAFVTNIPLLNTFFSSDEGDGEEAGRLYSEDPSAGAVDVAVRENYALYSWDELKAISRAISEAGSDQEGLEIAKRFNLVDIDGKLRGGAKAISLADGTSANVRIIGFRHDDLANGGKAGISFEFADVPVRHQMNASASNAGGWEECEARDWLNSDFIEMLPEDLRASLEPVVKETNNTGPAAYENDTSVVTTTVDTVWLLSMTEVYGSFWGYEYSPWSPATYEAEGEQYKLYADLGVTAEKYDYCIKVGAADNCWLRSPFAGGVERFRAIDSKGSWENKVVASTIYGIAPGFCI